MKKRFSSMSNLDVVRKYLAGERPYLTVSYNQTERNKYRKDGDEWEVDGIKYKKENGVVKKITQSQADIVRKSIGDALDCKMCKLQWKWANNLDRKFLMRTQLCESCLVEYETKLRILGIYDCYEKYRLASYELGFLKEKKEKFLEVIKYFKTNNGDIVKVAENEFDENIVWKNTNKDKILTDAKEDLKRVTKLISNGIKMTKEYKKEYRESVSKHKLPDIITKK